MLALLSSTVAVSFMATVISTLAWFNTTSNISPEENLNGFSDGAYFAGGDGLTAETAFIIRTPRHLYNLAWLQYLGYFNRDEKNNSTGATTPDNIIDHQYYFILDNDLDMNPGDSAKTQWTIPPIGTQKYPFVGTFLGNEKIISDLRISNYFGDYNKTPSKIKSSSDIQDLNILGFFGVVGTLNAGDDNNSIKSGDHTYTYDRSTTSITNVGLDNLEVKSTTGNIIIGLAGGYVNGPISGVAIKNSKITTSGNSRLTGFGTSSNLSDYSVAGYVRPKYMSRVNQKDVTAQTPQVDNDTVSGSGDEFGASIAMNTMYARLLGLKQSATGPTYATEESFFDGVKDDSLTVTSNFEVSYRVSNTNYTYGFSENAETDDAGHQISSYTFSNREKTTGNWSSLSNDYMYLYGNKSVNYNYTQHNYADLRQVPTNGTQFYIHEGENYLVNSSGTLSNTRNRAEATLWTYNNGVISNGSYNLRNNSGTLEASRYYSTTWTVTKNGNNGFLISSTASNRTYYLAYLNQGWTQLKYIDTSTRYYFSIGDNYFKWGGVVGQSIYAAIQTTTTTDDATEWVQDSNGNYYPYGYSQHILGFYYNTQYGDAFYLCAYSGVTLKYTYQQYSGNYYLGSTSRYNNGSTNYYYYATYDGSRFTSVGNNNQNTARTNAGPVTRTTVPTHVASDFGTYLYGKTDTQTQKTYTSKATYFPLSYEPILNANNEVTGYSNNISSKNTGYVVSGTYFQNDRPGDMRVSKYANSNSSGNKRLTASLNDGYYYQGTVNSKNYNLSVVTRSNVTNGFKILKDDYNFNNGNGSVSSSLTSQFGTTKVSVADAGLVKYTASRKQLHTLFNSTLATTGTTYLYGLHFMDAQINTNHKIQIPYASINGNEYYNYELPNDCIDFNLKNNGYVNFFAGSYFPGNTTFFSLHTIDRDENTKAITGIHEIVEIYKNIGDNRKQYKYIYIYDDGTKNCPIGTGGGQYNVQDKLFDTTWITNPTMVDNALYYFEIPVNKGEYALGSVDGKDGAYLIYLDIGAGVKTQNITTYTEKITTRTDAFDFVVGVDFVAVLPTDKDGYEAITGDLVANVSIPASTNGSTTFGYNASDHILTCAPPNGVTLSSTYIRYGEKVKVGTKTLAPSYISTSTEVLDKVTQIIYDNETEMVTKIVSTSTDGGDTWETGDPIVLKKDVVEYEASATIESAGVDIVHFHYQITSNATVTIDTEYDSDKDTYSITITSSEATTVFVDDVLESFTGAGGTTNYTVKINNVTVVDGQQVPISAS